MITDEDREHLQGHEIVCSVSGGKDSTAMALWLFENGLDPVLVFADTGWESEKTIDYLCELEDAFGKPIYRVGYPGGMEALIGKKGMFPSRTKRFCTQELKTKPLSEFMRARPGPTVNTVGIRAAESRSRASMPRWEFPTVGHFKGLSVWRPLIDWTFEDVVEIHRRHHLRPNPLYLEGFKRVGCFPCIFESKEGIRKISEDYPEQVETIRRWEVERVAASEERHGDELRHPNMFTFFQRNSHRSGPIAEDFGLVGKGGIPIDKAVQWAKSPRGAHPGQSQLFALSDGDQDAGCMRWGLCEHSNEGWEEV